MVGHNHRRQHDHHHLKRVAAAEPQSQDVEIVYVTASPTFTGKPAGYKTIIPGQDGEDTTITSKVGSKPTSQTSAAVVPTTKATPTSAAVTTKKTTEEDVVSDIPQSTKAAPVQTTLQTVKKPATTNAATDLELEASTATTADAFNTAAATTSTSTGVSAISATSSASSSSGGGLSGAATAGLVGGGIAILLLALAFAGYLYRRRSQKIMQEAYGKPEDEKFGMASSAAPMGGAMAGAAIYNEKNYSQSSFGSATPPPQLQVRAVSQFNPILNVSQGPSRPTSNVNGLAAPAAVLAAAAVKQQQQQPEPVKRFSYQDRAEQVALRRQSQQLLQQQAQQAQFQPVPIQPQQAPIQKQQPAPIEIPDASGFQAMPPPVNPFANTPGSPAMSTITDMNSPSVPSTPTVGGAIVPDRAAPVLPVFRVIMEFKPSMGDELELVPGELVRLMHEYDDGWALCSRMNGSQQGVCPRTCLSPRAVKPRPRNGTVSSQNAPFSPATNSRPGTPTQGTRVPQPIQVQVPQQPQAQPAAPQTPTAIAGPARPQTPQTPTQAPKQYKPYTPPANSSRPTSRSGTPKIQSRPQTPVNQVGPATVSTPQGSPKLVQNVPQSPVVPQILVSPSDEQPASPILGPVDNKSQVKVSSPLAKESTAAEEEK